MKTNNNFDPINKPKHYTNSNYETINIIADKLTPEQYEGFLIGNVLKYTTRYQEKNGVEDLRKANWYLTRLIIEKQTTHVAKGLESYAMADKRRE